MLLAVNFVSFLAVSLHHEVQVIRSTCYDILQRQQAPHENHAQVLIA